MYRIAASINHVTLMTIAIMTLSLVACGGGSGGTGRVPVSSVAGNTGAVSGVTEEVVDDTGGSGWIEGVFEPASTFRGQCANPSEEELGTPGTTTDENNWIRSMSNDTYLWYNEIVDVDPGTIDDPLDYFDLMRTFELTDAGNPKDKFHFTFDTEAWQQLSGSGISAGYGVTISLVSRTTPRRALVAYTEPDTPASSPEVNLARGAEILEVDGVDLINAEGATNIDVLNAGLFPEDVGETHEFVVRDLGSSETRTVVMESTQITSVPVRNVSVIDTANGPVGYVLFNDHIATSEQQLIDAVDILKAQEITDLVLDLRYNGGGFLDIANEMAYMIAGNISVGQTFDELQFNDKHPNFDPVTGRALSPSLFRTTARGFSAVAGSELPALDLSRVFVLTSSGTCSASEAIINGLTGIDVEVIQIGGKTCGKPYGFYALDNCGTSYFTIQFRGVNAKNFGDYSDGFAPSSDVQVPLGIPLPGCNVADDLNHLLGDPEEAMLAAALTYRETGGCPESPSARRLSTAERFGGEVVKPEWLKNMTATPPP